MSALRAFYERWDRLEGEKRGLLEDLKELFAEAKAEGYEPKALRVAFRRKSLIENTETSAETARLEAVVDLYLAELETGPSRAHPRDAREAA